MTWTEIPANIWLTISIMCAILTIIIVYRLEIISILKSANGISGSDFLRGLSNDPELFKACLGFVLVAILIFSVVVWRVFFHEPEPEYEWVHPTMNKAEQELAIIRCENDAYARFPHPLSQKQYKGEIRLCLEPQGFEQVEVGE